jgi:hypothetical protein
MRFLTVMIPAVAIVTALSLPAAAQYDPSHKGPPAKGPPAKAAPRGPVAGVHPGGPPGVHPGGPPGPGAGRPAYVGHPGPGARPAYAGHPVNGGHPGYRAAVARYPGFARRNFGDHYYRGAVAWDRGHWRHEWRNGRYGWWWDVGGAWYFYDQPLDGPPTFISDVEVLEDPALAADEPPPDGVPPEAYPEPVVVAPAPVVVVPPPIVCVGPLCVR